MIGTFGPLCGTLRSRLFAGEMSYAPGADAFGGAHELEWLAGQSPFHQKGTHGRGVLGAVKA